MYGELKQVKRVLFVDDSSAFLNMIEKIFGLWSKGSWEFIKAFSGEQAVAIMEEQRIHLVVIDLIMPGMDGLELLRVLHKRYPDLPKVMLTGAYSTESKEESLKHGAVHFLEKPATMESMEQVYRILDDLAEAQPEGGFQGMMYHVGLQEVLQIECLCRNSSVLEVTSGRRRGEVFIQNGAIIHAQAEGRKGIMALSFLLAMRGGEFALRPFVHPKEITVNGSWEALLMEAAQTKDEGGTKFLDAHDPAAKKDLPPPRVEEVIEDDSGPLGHWRGPNPEMLIEFLDTMHEKTREMSDTLGMFDRMEIYGDKSRIVAEITADNRILMHVWRNVDGADETEEGGQTS